MTPASVLRLTRSDRAVALRMGELHRSTRAARTPLVGLRVATRTRDLVHMNLCELVHPSPSCSVPASRLERPVSADRDPGPRQRRPEIPDASRAIPNAPRTAAALALLRPLTASVDPCLEVPDRSVPLPMRELQRTTGPIDAPLTGGGVATRAFDVIDVNLRFLAHVVRGLPCDDVQRRAAAT